MLGGAAVHFEEFMTCVPDCYDPKLPWSFRAKNFQVFEMGMDNDSDDVDYLQQKLDKLDQVKQHNTAQIVQPTHYT